MVVVWNFGLWSSTSKNDGVRESARLGEVVGHVNIGLGEPRLLFTHQPINWNTRAKVPNDLGDKNNQSSFKDRFFT